MNVVDEHTDGDTDIHFIDMQIMDAETRAENEELLESIRTSRAPYGCVYDGDSSRRHPFSPPAEGTTATAEPDASGKFSAPVYFSWGENWERVEALMRTPEMQAVLKHCVDEAADGYYFYDWSKEMIFPLWCTGHRRLGNDEQDALLAAVLPEDFVRDQNRRAATWWARTARAVFLQTGGPLADNHDMIYDSDEHHDELGSVLRAEQTAWLKGNLREEQMYASPDSYSWMPLMFKLAQHLARPNAHLRMFAHERYSCVIDIKHNIVFDNFWYFVDGQSAEDAVMGAGIRLSPEGGMQLSSYTLAADQFDYNWPYARWRSLEVLRMFLLFRADLPRTFYSMLRQRVLVDTMPYGPSRADRSADRRSTREAQAAKAAAQAYAARLKQSGLMAGPSMKHLMANDREAGTAVLVQGLTGAPELNGRVAVIQGFDDATGRFSVHVNGERRIKNIKPGNLMTADRLWPQCYPSPKKAPLQKCLSTVVLPKTSAGFGLVVGSDGSIGPGCSGAAAAGHAKMILTTGSKITAVNDVSVSSLDDIVTEMDKAQEGDDVSFTIEVVMSGGTRAAAPDSTTSSDDSDDERHSLSSDDDDL